MGRAATMTSTSSNPGKSLSVSSTPIHSPGPNQSNASASFESVRRPSQAGGSSSVAHHPTPRKGQGSRKQHRSQRRPGFRDQNVDEEDSMAELRALRNASSRRGQLSITHLLDYSVPTRSYDYGRHHAQSHGAYSRSYRRNPTWGPGSGRDKARYVHANYRFVVSPRGDYSEHAVDADKHLDWADVLQVLASAESQQASCPICLSEPVAPRMAKCGHIFCLSCLIRYMNSSPVGEDGHGSGGQARQSRWRKCPICEDSVYIAEVRPVRFYAGQESALPRPGDDVVLRLMMRNAGSTLALPKEGGVDVLNSAEDVPWHFAVDVIDYARIMKGTPGYMHRQYDREVEALQQQEKEDELLFHEGDEWTQKAIRAIATAREKLQDLDQAESAASSSTTAAAATSTRSRHVEQDFYFYTSPPHLYLSPLDIRILKTKYGSFSAFPSTLLPRVEHISTGHVVDDALRKRAKYLGHLPQGCLISFLECDWTDIVPAEILGSFAEEIGRRRKRNQDKAAQEERERLQAERIEAAAIRDARRNIPGGAVDEDVTIRFGASPPSDAAAVDFSDFQPLGSSSGGAQSSTPPNPRPGFAQLADVSTSPSAQRTVWGTPAVAASPEMGPARRPQLVNDDGWLKDDEVLETLGTAELAMQMEAFGLEATAAESGTGLESVPASAGATPGRGTPGGGAKKKKKQKITLMSTGGRRGA